METITIRFYISAVTLKVVVFVRYQLISVCLDF